MLQECSTFRVAGVFFREPTGQHYLIEISKKTGLAHTSVKRHLTALREGGIIKETKEKRGGRTFPIYKADLDSREYRKYKKMHNILLLEECGLVDFLKDRLMPRCIVAFGSYSRGEDVEGSDIDIFLECKKGSIDLSRFEKRLGRKVEAHFMESFREFPAELKNNIINGTVLSGYLEAF